ncbi:MAG: hypothetical protein AAGB32_03765 [Pseudomonadota bacterium]
MKKYEKVILELDYTLGIIAYLEIRIKSGRDDHEDNRTQLRELQNVVSDICYRPEVENGSELFHSLDYLIGLIASTETKVKKGKPIQFIAPQDFADIKRQIDSIKQEINNEE